MTKTLTLIAAAGLAMLTAAVPAHAEFGSNSDRGYGADSGSTRGGKSSPGAERGSCCKYTVSGKKLNKMDFEVGEQRQKHTEGGGKLKNWDQSGANQGGGPVSSPAAKESSRN